MPIAGTTLSSKLLESMKKYKEMLWQGFSYYLVSASVAVTISELESGSINDDMDDRDR
jgi:hypothetical protein